MNKKHILPTLACLMLFAGLVKFAGYLLIGLVVFAVVYVLWKVLV